MSFLNKVKKFAASPEGKRVFREAQRVAKDPNSRRKIAEARARLGGGKPPRA